MMQLTGKEVKPMARAIMGDLAVEFHDDGSATLTVVLTMECTRCGALHDLEGEPVTFSPPETWGLLGAVRRFLPIEAYRRVAEVVQAAIEGR